MHPLLRAHAGRQLGLFTAAEARRHGHTSAEIATMRRAGAWVPVRRGVYVTAADLAVHEASGRRHRVDCLAVLLTLGSPAAVVSHASAARLHGLPVEQSEPATVRLTDPHQWRSAEGHRIACAPLPPGDTVQSGPLTLTSVARTLVDCAREWELVPAVAAWDAGLVRRLVTLDALDEAVAAVHGWPGAGRAARALALCDARAESPLESRGRLRILGAGLPVPLLQVELHLDGALAVVDGWYEEQAVAVEFDGRTKYTDPRGGRSPADVAWDEKRREDRYRAAGVRFLRLAEADLDTAWPASEATLRRLLSRPGPVDRPWRAVPRAHGRVRA